MSFKDRNLQFGQQFAPTAAAAFTDVIDLQTATGNSIRNIGNSVHLWLYGIVNELAQSTASTTINFKLETSSTTAFSSPLTAYQTGAIAKATLDKGYEFFKVPLPSFEYQRYLRVYADVATAPLTAGSFSAWITAGVPAWTAYERNDAHLFGT